MKEFIEYLVKQIANKPEEVEVTTGSVEAGFTEYKIKVSPEDMGIIIGKEGKTINSIRNLVRSKAIKDNAHVKIVLDEANAMANATDQSDAQN